MKAYSPFVAAIAAAAVAIIAAVTPLAAATDYTASAPVAGRSTGSAVMFKAPLSGDAEVPPVPSDASGVALALLSDSVHLSVTWSFSGLPTPVDLNIGIHIHEAPAGQNGPILIPLTDDVVLMAGGTAGCGWSKIALNATQAQALTAGNLYLNIHTEGNPAGALRGQLLPTVSPTNGAADGPTDIPTESPAVDPTVVFPEPDAPEASVPPAFDVEGDEGVLLGPSDGPTTESEVSAGIPSVDEPVASSTPAAFGAGDDTTAADDSDDGFEGTDDDGLESTDDGDDLDGSDDIGGNLAGGQTAPPAPVGGDDDADGAATATPAEAADTDAGAGAADGEYSSAELYSDDGAAPTPYVVRVERT